ncbi:MAG: beta-galactosidase, partial [Anaerolineae bacterium]
FSRHFGGGFFKFDISERLQPDRANVIALHIRDYAGQPWRAWLLTYDADQALDAVWEYRAGVSATWSPHAEPMAPRPAFFRTRFAYDPALHGLGPFKLSLGSLRKGHLWLNGRSLGRYWQIGPQEFYKAPASWLAAANELVIFEEEDGTPAGARLWPETAVAAREWRARVE